MHVGGLYKGHLQPEQFCGENLSKLEALLTYEYIFIYPLISVSGIECHNSVVLK